MIEWIKTVFKNRPDTSTPITAKWLNDLQDYMMQLGLIKDYVVEYGSNPNGKWEKWASGKLVQTGIITNTYGTTQEVGALFRSDTTLVKNFPIDFIGIPELLLQPQSANSFSVIINGITDKQYNHRLIHYLNNQTDINVLFYAIGKWK